MILTQEILEPNEKIVWEGLVNRKVLFFHLALALIITLAISIFLFTLETIKYTSNGQPKEISAVLVGSIVLFLGISLSLLAFFTNFVRRYALTTKRVLLKSGLIGTDFKSLYYTQIRNIFVDVGVVGKMFSVGTIKIDTGQIHTVSSGKNSRVETAYDYLLHVDTPYEIYKYLQSILSSRTESLYSGRADRDSHPELYGKK